MTSIPPYPGVPAILGNMFTGGIPAIATTFVDLVSPSLFMSGEPAWGLYRDGTPALAFETFVSIDYREEYAISDYPLEDGGFESFNKVQVPYNVRVRFSSGGTMADRTGLLASAKQISGDLNLYTVVTPEAVYRSVNVQRVDYRRDHATSNGLIVIEMFLLEIRQRVVRASFSGPAGGAADAVTEGGGLGRTTYDLLVQPNTGSGLITQPQLPSGASIFNDGYVSKFDSAFQAFSPGAIRNDPARGFTVY